MHLFLQLIPFPLFFLQKLLQFLSTGSIITRASSNMRSSLKVAWAPHGSSSTSSTTKHLLCSYGVSLAQKLSSPPRTCSWILIVGLWWFFWPPWPQPWPPSAWLLAIWLSWLLVISLELLLDSPWSPWPTPPLLPPCPPLLPPLFTPPLPPPPPWLIMLQ